MHTSVPWLHSSHVILNWLLWNLTAELVFRPSGEQRALTWPFILSWFNRHQTHTEHSGRCQFVQTWNSWNWTLFYAIFSHHSWALIFGQCLWSRLWLYLFQMCPDGEDLHNPGWGKFNWFFSKHGSLWTLTLCNLLMRELTIGLAIVSWPESINSASSTVEITQYGYSIVWRICLSVQVKHLAPLTTSSKFGVFSMYLCVYMCICAYTYVSVCIHSFM